jgi:hypothetical protein
MQAPLEASLVLLQLLYLTQSIPHSSMQQVTQHSSIHQHTVLQEALL